MKVTISDVAKLAGVSTATVSHTINNTRYVSNETKEKVYRAIEELGYTPDASARSFRTGKKKIIGFIVPDIANKFFATMIESVEISLRQRLPAHHRQYPGEYGPGGDQHPPADGGTGGRAAGGQHHGRFPAVRRPDPRRISGGAGGPDL